ncbi:hypothetical protein PG987_000281 [Apiospora arundinis]
MMWDGAYGLNRANFNELLNASLAIFRIPTATIAHAPLLPHYDDPADDNDPMYYCGYMAPLSSVETGIELVRLLAAINTAGAPSHGQARRPRRQYRWQRPV